MEKLKTLIIILSFLLFLSTIISIGVFCLFDFRYFQISLGSTYLISTFFILSQFILILLTKDTQE
ncbi:hypothetical protein CKA55_07460 [Arcobacter suis]|nr:hypothetical protein CKA55_07460 [Arcobacter suis]